MLYVQQAQQGHSLSHHVNRVPIHATGLKTVWWYKIYEKYYCAYNLPLCTAIKGANELLFTKGGFKETLPNLYKDTWFF